jgi:hypothetical protein
MELYILKFRKNLLSASRVVCGRTDGEANRRIFATFRCQRTNEENTYEEQVNFSRPLNLTNNKNR